MRIDGFRKDKAVWTLISVLIFIFFFMFIVYPIFSILKSSIYENGAFTLENFRRFFGESYYSSTLINSLKIAVVVALCSLALGIPLAYFNTMYVLKGSTAIQIITILCSMSAPFVGAYSWILMFGRSGAITKFLSDVFGFKMPNIYGFAGIVIVMTTKLFPLVYLYVCGAIKNIDNSLLEASESMGVVGVKCFWKITFQLCVPSVLAVTMMVFIRALADYGTPALIGEGYRTFSVEIYKQYMGEGGNSHGFASAISVVAIAITAVFFFAQRYFANKHSFKMNALHPIQKKKAKGLYNVFIHVVSYALVAFSFLPQVYLVYCSFRKTTPSGQSFIEGYSLNNYRLFFARMGESVWNTLLLGGFTLIVTISIAVLISYLIVRLPSKLNNTIDTLSMLPYVIPGSVVGIALVISYSTRPLVLTGTFIIMVIAISIRRMPYTIRSSVATLQQIPITVEEAAESLGTTRGRTFLRITIPMMSNGIISGAILSWITILTELSTSIILYSSNTITLTLATYNFVSRGNYGCAAASASILTFFTALSLVLFFRISKTKDLSM